MYASQPPLKLPTANMVTRGYGSIDEERLRASFSVPIYYFKNCEIWTFFTDPTQVGMPYSGTPPSRTFCNISNLCVTPSKSYLFGCFKNLIKLFRNSALIQGPSGSINNANFFEHSNPKWSQPVFGAANWCRFWHKRRSTCEPKSEQRERPIQPPAATAKWPKSVQLRPTIRLYS